jgi:hypothetical protein
LLKMCKGCVSAGRPKMNRKNKMIASEVWLIGGADHDEMSHPQMDARPWMGFGTRVKTCQV